MKLLKGRPERKLLTAGPTPDYFAQLTQLRDKMIAQLGIPQSMLGDLNTNYATAEASCRIFQLKKLP